MTDAQLMHAAQSAHPDAVLLTPAPLPSLAAGRADPERTTQWLHTPHPALRWDTPNEAIAGGRGSMVLRLINGRK